MDIPTLETERLILREIRQEDLDDFLEIFSDPKVTKFVAEGGAVADRNRAWRIMAGAMGHWVLKGFGLWGVEEKSTGRLIGEVGIHCPEGFPSVEAAWTLGSASWGKGYASEAARRSVQYAFEVLDLDHIISLIDPLNVPSQSVAKKIGEKNTGETFRFPNMAPAEIWRLDRQDWMSV